MPGREFTVTDAAMRTGVLVAEKTLFLWSDDLKRSIAPLQRAFNRVCNAWSNLQTERNAVDDEFDGVTAFLVELDRLGQILDRAVHAGAHKAFASHSCANVPELTIATFHQSRKQHD